MKKFFLGFLTTMSLLSNAWATEATQNAIAAGPNPCSPFDPRCVPLPRHHAPTFQGLFFGVNVGYGIGAHKKTYQFATVSNKIDTSSNGLQGGVNIGYSHRLGNLGVGIEGVWDISNVKGSKESTWSKMITSAETVSLKNSLQLRGNVFYVIDEIVAPKLIIGWDRSEWARVFVTTERGTNVTVTSKHPHNSWVAGLGVDFAICNHVIAGFEYTALLSSQNISSLNRKESTSFRPHHNKIAFVLKFIY